ncbi:MAG: hypothetical protein Q8M15_07145 [Bacteroidota bacterium]|nr:hypothetical protein [Bacteroidota bacterium]
MKQKLIIKLFLLNVIFSNCAGTINNCPDKIDVKTEKITDQEKLVIPYSGNDTLVLLSNNNVKHTFIGKGITSFWLNKTIYANKNRQCAQKYELENYQINFFDSLDKNEVKIGIFFDLNFNESPSDKKFVISKELDNLWIGTNAYFMTNTSYFDSIIVQGKPYYHIIKLIGRQSNSLENDSLYYSLDYGLLRLKNGLTHESWDLLEKK